MGRVARLPWGMAAATVLTGLGAGGGGILMTIVLHAVEHAAFGYQEGSFGAGVQQAPHWRRVAGLAGGGLVTGVGWWLFRTRVHQPVSVTGAVREGRPLPLLPATADALLQITAVGAGASLGREGAPRQIGAAFAGWLAARFGLSAGQRRTLLACGAGAGLTAIYNVPIGGALFTLEILLHSIALEDVLPAVVTSGIATVVTWPVLGNGPTYQVAPVSITASLLVATIAIGPAAGLIGHLFRHLATLGRESAPHGWRAAVLIPVTFACLGAVAIAYPDLLGNGKALAQFDFDARVPTTTALAFVWLKPLATAACLRAGAIGGLLTPSFATGASLGLALGAGWTALWPAGATTAFAITAAGALLAVTQRAPLTAVILAVEFTRVGERLLVPLVLATGLALGTSALVDRLPSLRQVWWSARRRGRS